jgi:hypothetical protein
MPTRADNDFLYCILLAEFAEESHPVVGSTTSCLPVDRPRGEVGGFSDSTVDDKVSMLLWEVFAASASRLDEFDMISIDRILSAKRGSSLLLTTLCTPGRVGIFSVLAVVDGVPILREEVFNPSCLDEFRGDMACIACTLSATRGSTFTLCTPGAFSGLGDDTLLILRKEVFDESAVRRLDECPRRLPLWLVFSKERVEERNEGSGEDVIAGAATSRSAIGRWEDVEATEETEPREAKLACDVSSLLLIGSASLIGPTSDFCSL